MKQVGGSGSTVSVWHDNANICSMWLVQQQHYGSGGRMEAAAACCMAGRVGSIHGCSMGSIHG